MSLAQGSFEPATRGSVERLQFLLRSSGQPELTKEQADQFGNYLAILIRWNTKINLTAIREGEGILRRHFLESILCARLLPSGIGTVLDFGSGGGFPGVPCAICRPEFSVTLAESQAKKAAFLREVVRSLGLKANVYHGRVEDLPQGMQFGAVTLRAVDQMLRACVEAVVRLRAGGWLVVMATESSLRPILESLSGITWRDRELVRGSEQEVVLIGQKLQEPSQRIVPRGTI